MTVHPRYPVIVGAAQILQKPEDPREARDPISMMESALRAAADDSEASAILNKIDKIYVPRGLWRYGDAGRMLADRVGSPSAKTAGSIISGHIVQVMIDRACREILDGRHDVVAIVGGESENSKRRLAKSAPEAIWTDDAPGEPDESIGSYGDTPILPVERKAGALMPPASFALCETSLRFARGETPLEHRQRIAALWSRLSAVAEQNPFAWIRRHIPAEEILTETPQNRMVNYPYTKLMTSNVAVDQSAALLLCSKETALRCGVPENKFVYPRVAVEMNHATHLSEREELHHHPGLHLAAQRLLEISETGPEEFEHIDLYSCFPFAVQASARALGLEETRPLTVTGGLTFSGGPFGNYVLQSAARIVELLRRNPGQTGLLGSVGGSFAKFAYGTYGTDPGTRSEPVLADVSEDYRAAPSRPYLESYDGKARVESYTVHVAHEGPRGATFALLTPEGERVWAQTNDRPTLAALLNGEEACGKPASVRDGGVHLD